MDYQVKLRYAKQTGTRIGIKQFDHLRGDHKKRPTDLYCPECEDRLTLKLSQEHKMQDHFAHRKHSECPLRDSGESVYHLNAKNYLADRLAARRNAELIFRCQICSNKYPYLQIKDY